jgi:hypothetical protein
MDVSADMGMIYFELPSESETCVLSLRFFVREIGRQRLFMHVAYNTIESDEEKR